MKKAVAVLKHSADWLMSHVGVGDVLALGGAVVAYDGAVTVFGSGWARFAFGAIVVLVYVLREFRASVRSVRGRS